MEGFDSNKEVKYISTWLLIVSVVVGITLTVAKYLALPSYAIIYVIIITILLIFIYFKSKEAEHYKNQILELEKNRNGKENTK